jgi:hypothetical protein
MDGAIAGAQTISMVEFRPSFFYIFHLKILARELSNLIHPSPLFGRQNEKVAQPERAAEAGSDGPHG